jgi:transposase-like protein
MLPPNNMPLRRLSQEEGISQATLAKWRAEARAKGQFLPDAHAGSENWTSRDKLAAVIGEPLCRQRFETNGERVDERG